MTLTRPAGTKGACKNAGGHSGPPLCDPATWYHLIHHFAIFRLPYGLTLTLVYQGKQSGLWPPLIRPSATFSRPLGKHHGQVRRLWPLHALRAYQGRMEKRGRAQRPAPTQPSYMAPPHPPLRYFSPALRASCLTNLNAPQHFR